MAKVSLNGTPQFGDDTYNVYDDVEELTIKTKYETFTIWFDKEFGTYIQADGSIVIDTEVDNKRHCIKIYT